MVIIGSFTFNFDSLKISSNGLDFFVLEFVNQNKN
ncbi:MAG: hypothetical protein RIS13_794 [Bacteroidota bacterium]|jgi:hypothetical protein